MLKVESEKLRILQRYQDYIVAFFIEQNMEKSSSFFIAYKKQYEKKINFNERKLIDEKKNELNGNPILLKWENTEIIPMESKTFKIIAQFSVTSEEKLSFFIHNISILQREEQLGEYFILSSKSTLQSLTITEEKKSIYLLKKETEKLCLDLLKHFIDVEHGESLGGIWAGYGESRCPLFLVGESILQALGYTPEEFQSSKKGLLIDCLHPDDRLFFEEQWKKHFDMNGKFEFQCRLNHKDGKTVWFLNWIKKINIGSDKIGFVCLSKNITDLSVLQQNQIKSMESLHIQNKQMETMIQDIPIGFIKCLLNNGWQMLFINDALCQLLGYTRYEIQNTLGNCLSQLIFEEDRDMVYTILRKKGMELEENESFSFEYRIQKKNGEILWICNHLRILIEDKQRVCYCAITDITQVKEVYQSLESLTASIPGGAFTACMDEDLTLIFGNDGFYELIGYSPLQMKLQLGNRLIAMIYPEDVTEILNIIATSFQEGQKGFEFEKRIFKNSGETAWNLVKGNFVRKNNGQTILHCVAIDITDRKQMEQSLKMNEERFRIALKQTENEIFDYNIAEKTMVVSKDFAKRYDLPIVLKNVPHSLVDKGVIYEDDIQDFFNLYDQIASGIKCSSCSIQMRTQEGNYLWNKFVLTTLFDDAGSPVRAIGIIEDITAQREAEIAYLKEEQYRSAMLSDAIADMEINVTKNILERYRGIWCEYEKLKQDCNFEEFIRGISDKMIYAEDRQRHIQLLSREHLMASYHRGIREVHSEHRRWNGKDSFHWMVTTIHLLKDPISGDMKGVGYLKNIDQKKKEELRLQYLSQRDSLTGLYNKRTTEEAVKDFLTSCKPEDKHCFFIIDLDDFKNVNDNYGHMFGDWVLLEMSQRMRNSFCFQDIIGRIGGDEFAILAKDIGSIDRMKELALQICHLVSFMEGTDQKISCSVGISCYPKDGYTFEELYQKADIALYEAKNHGRNQFAIYDDSGKDLFYFSPNDCTKDKNSTDVTRETPSIKENAMSARSRKQSEKEAELDSLEGIVYVSDPDNYNLLYMNEAGAQMLQMDKKHCVGKKCYQLIQGLDKPCTFCNKSLLKFEKYHTCEYYNQSLGRRFLVKDKLIQWNGKTARLEIAFDITHKSQEKEIETQSSEIETILSQCVRAINDEFSYKNVEEIIAEAVGKYYQADRVYIMEWNKKTIEWKDIFAWCKDEVVSYVQEWKQVPVREITFFGREFYKEKIITVTDVAGLKKSIPTTYERLKKYGVHSFILFPLNLGEWYHGYICIDNPTKYHKNKIVLESLNYILSSELSKQRKDWKLEYVQYYDILTGLPNRRKYLKYLDEVNEQSIVSMGAIAANINGLRVLNKLYGEIRGNHMILKTVDIFRNYVENETIFRLDGDEFILLCPNMSHQDFLQKIYHMKEEFVTMNENGVSIGHTWADTDIDIPGLVRHANELMMLAKQQYYEKNKVTNKHFRSKALQELLTAIRQNQFQVVFQPKIDIVTNAIVGAEALVRRSNPEGGLIPPSKFIPALEENRLIRYIDFFVLEYTCKVLQQWKSEGKPLIPISVNFSRLTLLEENLVDSIGAVLRKYDLSSEYIEIEITETIGEMERETISQVGKNLKNNGYKIALDDFGTKYTNLSMLTTIDFDVLKLDGSLVKRLEESEKNQVIVDSIVKMCNRIGIEIIAEGVETEEQRKMLRNLGCAFAQGYYYSKPISRAEFDRRYLC